MVESERAESEQAWLGGRSPVRAAAVAVLLERPGHGYDVAKRINMRVGSSVRIEPKHIYSVLASLEKAGLVRSRKESDIEPRGRTIFYPTNKAKQAWRGLMRTPPAMTIVRQDIQARLAFSNEADTPDLLQGLGEYCADLLEAIAANAAIQAPGTSWAGRIMRFEREGVERRLKAELAWVLEVCRDLERVGGERPDQ